MIKAIIFDVDGVLVHSFEANHKFFGDLFRKFGYTFMSKEDYENYFHLTTKDIVRHTTKSTDEDEIHKIWTSTKKGGMPYPDELLEFPNSMSETIEKLSKKYTLGIATSRTLNPLEDFPELKLISKYFRAVVLYEDTENHKPHPEPLLLAAQKLNLNPSECVYVGDSATDIVAARASGMKAINYNKRIREEADLNIAEFSKLEEAVESL
ncbi:MAG: HAD family hydrolase [Candidatus Pacebacteria bacterium]|nr:HAD family hydrolase [Candidatus Paceibacterota bacterium]